MTSLSMPSPVGPLTIDEADDRIVAIRWADEPAGNGSPLLNEAARQLAAYFDGKLDRFRPAAGAGRHRRSRQRVWAAMQGIPYGETRCYGDLAETIGSAPRAVGGACGRNPIPIVIPCHRVLAKTGLGGYSGDGRHRAPRPAFSPSKAPCARGRRRRAEKHSAIRQRRNTLRFCALQLYRRGHSTNHRGGGDGAGDPFCEDRRARGFGAGSRSRPASPARARCGSGTPRSGSTTSTPTSAAGFTRCRCRAASARRRPASSRRSGPGVTGLKPGDRVAYAGGPLGAYSEARVMPADRLVPLPDGITDEQAAAMMLKGMTAWYLVRRTHPVKAGRDDPDPCRRRRRRPHRLPMGETSRRHRDRHRRRRRKGDARQGARLRPRRSTTARRISSRVSARSRPARNCRWSTISVGKDTFFKSLDCIAPLGLMASFGQSSGAVAPVDHRHSRRQGLAVS